MDVGHGRMETRILRIFEASDLIENRGRWKDLNYILHIEAHHRKMALYFKQDC